MKTRDLALCGLCAAGMAVCAWITVPIGDIGITMQTFGLFLTLGLLGGGKGFLACVTYLALGAIGLPVFSGFKAGLGVLLGPTGGYILGFLAACPVYWLVTARGKGKKWLGMLLGLLACYAFGSLWFWLVYLPDGGLWAVLVKCVLPFILPDLCKMVLALGLARRLAPALKA